MSLSCDRECKFCLIFIKLSQSTDLTTAQIKFCHCDIRTWRFKMAAIFHFRKLTRFDLFSVWGLQITSNGTWYWSITTGSHFLCLTKFLRSRSWDQGQFLINIAIICFWNNYFAIALNFPISLASTTYQRVMFLTWWPLSYIWPFCSGYPWPQMLLSCDRECKFCIIFTNIKLTQSIVLWQSRLSSVMAIFRQI